MTASADHMDVFVHLAYGYDAASWEKRWASGELVGFNERYPYGYHLARDMACSVRFSCDADEALYDKLPRLLVRGLLGFDFVHAWRNRREIMTASIVWTHTESQHLAIALLMKVLRPRRRPHVIGQSVWLIDKWESFPRPYRSFYRWLLREIDLLTFHSPINAAKAADLFGKTKCLFMPFGIRDDITLPPGECRAGPIRIVAIGNDRHRDWDCLLRAFANDPMCTVDVVSKTFPMRKLSGVTNFVVHHLKKQEELVALYDRADVVVIPLRLNMHASGISCILEASLIGKPTVCSRAGGLTSYFGENEIAFVEPDHADELRARVYAVARDPNSSAMVRRAQDRIRSDGFTSLSYVRRHVVLSRMLQAHEQADAANVSAFALTMVVERSFS